MCRILKKTNLLKNHKGIKLIYAKSSVWCVYNFIFGFVINAGATIRVYKVLCAFENSFVPFFSRITMVQYVKSICRFPHLVQIQNSPRHWNRIEWLYTGELNAAVLTHWLLVQKTHTHISCMEFLKLYEICNDILGDLFSVFIYNFKN